MIHKLLAGVCYAQARWFLSLGRLGWGQGSRLLHLACRLWPRHPEAPLWLKLVQGKEALRRGRPDVALPLLLEAERALPPSLGLRADVGLAQVMVGNWEQAIVVLERAVKEEEAAQREDVWASLAWAYLKTGRAPKARESCLRAEQMGVQSLRLTLLQRFATAVGLGALPVSELSDLLERLPEAGVLVLEFARQQAQEGRRQLARAAVTAFPADDQPRAFAIIARGSLNEDDPDSAAWAAEQIAAPVEKGLSAEVALIRSEVALRRGEQAEAIAQARAALEAERGTGRAHEQVGRALLLAGDWDSAVDEMIEALHTAGAGALAGGVAALAALEVGDQQSARGIFLSARCGDGLACAISHTAQARLLLTEGHRAEALRLVEEALDEMARLPRWARRPDVLQRLARVQRDVLQATRDAGEGEQQDEAERLLERLAALTEELST